MHAPQVIEAASHEEVEQKVHDMNSAAYDKWAAGGYKGGGPGHLEKEIVSDIASSGSVRAVVYERPCLYDHTFPAAGNPMDLGEVRNPFGELGGGR